jgi:hypothetical protein
MYKYETTTAAAAGTLLPGAIRTLPGMADSVLLVRSNRISAWPASGIDSVEFQKPQDEFPLAVMFLQIFT